MFSINGKTRDELLYYFGRLKTEKFKLDSIAAYFDRADHSKALQVISDKTCNDLDLEAIFMYVDRTTSKVGQQYLYNNLRTIPDKQIPWRESLIKTFTDDIPFRLKVQKQLRKLTKNDVYNIPALIKDEYLKPPGWFWIIRLLSVMSLLCLIFLVVFPFLFFALLPIAMANMFIHFWNKRNLYMYLSSLPQLLILQNVAQKLSQESLLKPINPTINRAIQSIARVKKRMFFFRMEASTQQDLEAIAGGILEIIKAIFLIEPLFLFGALRQLDHHRKEIEELFQFVGETDLAISIASLRSGPDNYCLPEITSREQEIKAGKVYHPLIKDCITNSIALNHKSVLLTGSNMSGKTSFIRTVGINVITALTLNTCFAEKFVLPRMKVFSAIRISDDLLNDKSYYFEEVLTIKEMIDESNSKIPCLFLLDEIFKGTNTIERIAAGKAVLSRLARDNNIVFVSTHDIELTDLLRDDYELYHFSEKVAGQSVDFDYQLKEGKLKKRNAVKILEINGYPESVVKEALALSQELDQQSQTKN